MDFRDLASAARNKMVQLREITISPASPQQVERQQCVAPQHPLHQQFARGMLAIGLICTLTGLVGLLLAPASKKNADRGHQIEMLQLEQHLRPMPPAEYKRRFEEILKK